MVFKIPYRFPRASPWYYVILFAHKENAVSQRQRCSSTVKAVHSRQNYRKSQNGVTIVELVLAMVVVSVLAVTVIVFVNPPQIRAKARDGKRISDLSVLERMILEYRLDNGSLPDLPDILRISTSLPGPGSISLENPSAGWIDANLLEYNTVLPIDPVNNGVYFYSYFHNDSSFEINAILENQTEYMTADNGNDPNVYEKGTDLTLISP